MFQNMYGTFGDDISEHVDIFQLFADGISADIFQLFADNISELVEDYRFCYWWSMPKVFACAYNLEEYVLSS